MNNFELVDEYLANRLKGAELEAFEKQLESDPALKAEYDTQKLIIDGIKKARSRELKAMLNNVPVGGSSVPFEFSVVRMAAGLIAAGAIASTLYFYFKPNLKLTDASTDLLKKTEQKLGGRTSENDQPETTPSPEVAPAPEKEKATPPPSAEKNITAEKATTTEAKKPTISVVDPTEELSQQNSTVPEITNLTRERFKAASVEIEVDSSNKTYDFHYQFLNQKLLLYGTFDKTLYELIEVNGSTRSLFLFYKDQYFLLNEGATTATRLSPVKDAELIKKLKEYRNQ